jgi:hypothetical protein
MGNRGCEIQTVEDAVDARLGLNRLGAPAWVQKDPDPSGSGGVTKGQARFRTKLNQHRLLGKFQELLY